MAVPANQHVPPDAVRVRRALLSVFDKTGLVALGRALHAHGAELVSTGGSARSLSEAGLPVTDVSTVTGFPEILGGRVKTLHPLIHGGLLAVRADPAHGTAMAEHGIAGLDLLAVNLYPFTDAVASGADAAEILENIDIGGPAMIRAGAKNHGYCCVLCDPADYGQAIEALRAGGGALDLAFRRRMAARAFARTASYDAAVAGWFGAEAGEAFPERLVLGGTRAEPPLRYGENPHQAAAFYRTGEGRPGVATARQVQGKALSFNNIADTDAAFECVAEFGEAPAVVIVKHANPCGAAVAKTLVEAYARALACDPVSAFGGIVALNRRLDGAAAEAIAAIFTEVVIAPDADADALAIFARKSNLRLLLAGALPDPRAPGLVLRQVAGGLLAQARDAGAADASDWRVVTRRAPDAREAADLLFAERLAKHVKSNAIVFARQGAAVGIGAGQMSRLDAARIAVLKAEDAARAAGLAEPGTRGSVVASDAFFPFTDGLLACAKAGASAVIQPGGSMRDAELIEAADAAGIAMVFTGTRHFRH